MPAILDGDEAIRKWLDFAEVPTQEAVKLIQPTENIVFHPVSTFVNSIRNNTPECLAPIKLGDKKVSGGGSSAGKNLIVLVSLSRDSLGCKKGSSRQHLQVMVVHDAGVQSPRQPLSPLLSETNCHHVPGFLCQIRQIPCEIRLGTRLFPAAWETSQMCPITGRAFAPAPASCSVPALTVGFGPALTMHLTSLALSFVSLGG